MAKLFGHSKRSPNVGLHKTDSTKNPVRVDCVLLDTANGIVTWGYIGGAAYLISDQQEIPRKKRMA